jgi:hypothetical protein
MKINKAICREEEKISEYRKTTAKEKEGKKTNEARPRGKEGKNS